MTTPSILQRMPELPRPGQKVRWRNPLDARRRGWEDVFGPGPYEVVGLVDQSDGGLAANIVLHTSMGERAVPEVWLALDEEGEGGAGGRQAASVGQPAQAGSGCGGE